MLPNILGLDREEVGGFDDEVLKAHKIPDAVKGLSGLIVLGNAWESADVFYALSIALGVSSKQSLQTLAEYRVTELVDSGKKSMLPWAPSRASLKKLMDLGRPVLDYPKDAKELPGKYHELRDEANQWHQKRQAFMLTRLKAGSHPDTDSNFWQGYFDPGPPQLHKPTLRENIAMKAGSIAVIGGVLLLSILLISRKKRHRVANAY